MIRNGRCRLALFAIPCCKGLRSRSEYPLAADSNPVRFSFFPTAARDTWRTCHVLGDLFVRRYATPLPYKFIHGFKEREKYVSETGTTTEEGKALLEGKKVFF